MNEKHDQSRRRFLQAGGAALTGSTVGLKTANASETGQTAAPALQYLLRKAALPAAKARAWSSSAVAGPA